MCRANTGSFCSSMSSRSRTPPSTMTPAMPFGLGRKRGETPKGGNAVAGVVDDENVARRGDLDHIADLEVLGAKVAARARHLPDGDRAAAAARARHDLGEPAHHAS